MILRQCVRGVQVFAQFDSWPFNELLFGQHKSHFAVRLAVRLAVRFAAYSGLLAAASTAASLRFSFPHMCVHTLQIQFGEFTKFNSLIISLLLPEDIRQV